MDLSVLLSHLPAGAADSAAGKAIEAHGPGEGKDPLFLWGPAGTGKTALLKALEEAAEQQEPEAGVLYQSARSFLVDLVDAIRWQSLDALDLVYDGMDLWLLDQLEELQGLATSQRELARIILRVQAQGGRTILAAACPPEALETLHKTLRAQLPGYRAIALPAPATGAGAAGKGSDAP